MSEPLLKIRHHHVPEYGDPPIVRDDKNLYIGYFENPHGEQWIFTFDRATRNAELRGGDVGWNEIYRVNGGQVADLILSAEERQWLQAGWRAATKFID
jgi:hypothetical protein